MQIPFLSSILSVLGLTSQFQSVDLGYATFKGVVNQESQITNFYGIRYAQAPIGQLRWNAPVAIEGNFSKNVVIDATEPSIACVMEQTFSATPDQIANVARLPQGEDCLTLNVQSPSNIEDPSNAKLPVLVNIHGGGYLAGDKDDSGTFFISQSNNSMIYVSVNYRLGMYGFLSGSQVKENGSLNAGLLDQRLALQWVKNHIERFGGDPDKITIIGDSAGGGSVTYQMTAFDGEDSSLFRGAVVQFPWWTPVWNDQTQEIALNHVLATANCSDIACLRELDEPTLKQVSTQVQRTNGFYPQSGYGLFTFSPVIDGTFVKQRPSESFQSGKYQKVPFIVTRSLNEGQAFTSLHLLYGNQTAVLDESLVDWKSKFPMADEKFKREFLSVYPPLAYPNVFAHRRTWFGDAFVNCPTEIMADFASPEVPVYKMLFSTGSTYHGASQPYMFSPYTYTSVLDQKTSKSLTRYVNSFVATGDPNSFNGDDMVYWKTYHGDDKEYNILHIEVGQHTIELDPDHNDRCKLMFDNANIISN